MFDSRFMISLQLILDAAWLMGSLFSCPGLPFVLGELLAGVIIGPLLLGLVSPSPGSNCWRNSSFSS